MIIPIVIDALGTITKGLLKDLEGLEVGGRVETIQMTALQKRPESWDESWRLEETCCHSDWCEKLSKEKNNNYDSVETIHYWRKLCGQGVALNTKAEWLINMKNE